MTRRTSAALSPNTLALCAIVIVTGRGLQGKVVDLVMRYLDSDDVKLSELAVLLGFSSYASFTASFKKWTWRTPSDTRTLS
ncbi:MAG: helix-turn-helix domain-containing protein [Hyphomicrobiaceae bacterium]